MDNVGSDWVGLVKLRGACCRSLTTATNYGAIFLQSTAAISAPQLAAIPSFSQLDDPSPAHSLARISCARISRPYAAASHGSVNAVKSHSHHMSTKDDR
jgi:hypothetical protein